MAKEIYKKLIRDRIPEFIESLGKKPVIHVLEENEFKKKLKEKFLEEAKEVFESKTKEELLNELCDIEELVIAAMKAFSISKEELEEKILLKRKERGSFEKKLFLEYVESK